MTLPFENDTRIIVKKLAKRSLQADKRRNIFLILTIILTTALLSGMFFTVFAKQRELKDNIRGQYQAVVMETTPEEIDRLSVQSEIEQWGLSQNFGTTRYQDSNLTVEYADEGWMVLGKKPSYIGTFPQAENRVFYSSNYFDMQGFHSNSVYVCIPIAIIFLTACGLVIYSIFFISIRGKLREYGRLKVLGTTPRQLRRIIRRESFWLSICSIPIGLIIGALLGFIARPSYWEWKENLLLAVCVAGFTELIVMFSTHAPIRLATKVSPIEAVRDSGYQTEAPKKSSRKSGKHISPVYLAMMNFQRNPKKAVLTLLSLSLTGVFLFSAATVLRSVNVNNMAASSMYDDCNYTIMWEASPEELLEISRENPLTPELREKVLAVDGVKSIIPRTSSAAILSLPNGVSDDFELHTFTREEMEELIPEKMMVDGTSDYDELVKNHGIVITDSMDDPMLSMLSGYQPKVGDIITFQPYGGEPTELTVMGIADSKKVTKTTGIAMFTLPVDLAQQLYPDVENMDRVWNVFTEQDTDSLRKELFSLLDDPRLNIISRSDYGEEFEVALQSVMLLIYGLLCFLFLFALVNLVNTLITNLLSRQQEFGVLQSVGMSGRQLSKMLTMECLCYIIATLVIMLLFGGLIGAFLVVLITKANIVGPLVYQFPIWELLTFAAALLLILVLYSAFAVRYMRRQSLVERIKAMS